MTSREDKLNPVRVSGEKRRRHSGTVSAASDSNARRLFLTASSSVITMTSSKNESTGGPQARKLGQRVRIRTALDQRHHRGLGLIECFMERDLGVILDSSLASSDAVPSNSACRKMFAVRLLAAARLSAGSSRENAATALSRASEVEQCIRLPRPDGLEHIGGNHRVFVQLLVLVQEVAPQSVEDEN